MNNAELVNYFYKLVGRGNNKAIATYDSTVLFDGGKPTQSDKPSPHSSYELNDLWRRSRKAFPEDRVHVFEVANTNSMEPLFDDNCQVITETIDAIVLKNQPLTKGDIVVYGRGDSLIIHRLMESRLINNTEYWLISGDNNYVPDGWIKTGDIHYRLVGILYGRQRRTND
jgi:hypothetical protein